MIRPAGGLLLIVACLLTLGVIMVSSAGMTIDGENPVTLRSILLGRPAVHAMIAAAALGLGAIVRVDRLSAASWMPWLAVGVIPISPSAISAKYAPWWRARHPRLIATNFETGS